MIDTTRVKIALLIVAGLAGMTATVGAGAAEDYKIGVVDLLRVLEEVPQANKARKLIEAEFSGKEKDLNAMTKKLREMEGKLAKDAAVMSEKDQRGMERDIIASRREIKRLQEEYREDLSYRRNEELSKLQDLIRETIQTLAKKGRIRHDTRRRTAVYQSGSGHHGSGGRRVGQAI